MLYKLQRKTLVISQLVGYALTLLVGITIVLLTIQLYLDIKPLLSEQTDVFKDKSAVISKNISVFKTMDKRKVYFTREEIAELQSQTFTKSVSKFTSANFKIGAYLDKTESMPMFYTDLFFESIPDNYLDVKANDWKWDISLGFIPIIIPENYLNLYNFGFAESQGLPVVSKTTISEIEFNVSVSGNGKTKHFKSKIVGFSNKINSILVPEDFLFWANAEFGQANTEKTSRLLIEFHNPSDEAILNYFNEKNYSINRDKLEFSKLTFFFKSALLFVFFTAVVIIILAISFIFMSISLIIQRNKELLINLYNIGYNYRQIARFYQVLISVITAIIIFVSIIMSSFVRNYYLDNISGLFEFTSDYNSIYVSGILLTVLLVTLYNVFIIRNVKKTVVPTSNASLN